MQATHSLFAGLLESKDTDPTPEDQKRDCDDIQNCDVLNSPEPDPQPQSILPRKRPAPSEHEEDEEDEEARLKEGKVTAQDDKFFMDLGWEVGGKWEEVGVSLGVEYKVLQSVVGSQVGKPDHMKAFYMFLEWRKRYALKATYATLAKALEESGLNSCAEQYCYTTQ